MLNEKLSLWFMLPILLSFSLFSTAYQDYLFMPVCLLALVIPILLKSNISIKTWPQERTLAILVTIATVFCSGYFLIFLSQKGFILLTTVGLLSALATALTWYTETKISLKKDLILALSIAIACSSVGANSADKPSNFFYILLVIFSLVILLFFTYLGGGLNLQDKRFIGRRLAITLLSIFAVIVTTYTIRSGIGHTERRLFLMFAEGSFFSRNSFTDPIGVMGDINIPRQSNLQLSSEIIASINDTQTEKYLRTQVLTQYNNGKWSIPSISTTNSEKKYNYIELLDKTLASSKQTQITLYEDLHGAVPLPTLTQAVKTSNDIFFTPTNGSTLRCSPSQNLKQYNIKKAINLSTQQLSDLETSNLLVSPEIQEALHPLAEEISKSTSSSLELAKSIQEYFRANYVYSLKVELKPKSGVDPIVDFVLNRRPAYCKYFASGMVLMLRSLGVPARVVSGFYVKEYNPLSKEWIMRGRDAHVWCEVYDKNSQQWVSFDPTPPAALEMQVETGVLAQISRQFELLKLHLSDLALATFYWLYNWIPANVGKVIAILILAILATLGLRFRSKIIGLFKSLTSHKQTILPAHETTPTTVKLARREFERVTQLLQQHKLPITETETLTEYFERLKIEFTKRNDFQTELNLLEEFFQLYQELRFRDTTTDQQPANNLSKIADRLVAAFSVKESLR